MPTPYLPRLARLIAADALDEAARTFESLALSPGAVSIADALELAADILTAIGEETLPPRRTGALRRDVPSSLCGPVSVLEGVRPLLGELGYLALETGRHCEAVELFDALSALASDQAAGPVGLAATFVAAGQADDGIAAGRLALKRAPGDPAALAALAEALVFAGRPGEARRVIASADRPVGPGASWLRLMRRGLDEGWMQGEGSGA